MWHGHPSVHLKPQAPDGRRRRHCSQHWKDVAHHSCSTSRLFLQEASRCYYRGRWGITDHVHCSRNSSYSSGFATPPSTRWRGLQPTGAPLCRRLRVMPAALGQDDAPARLSLVPKWKRCGQAACSAIVFALSLAVSPGRQVCSPGPSWAISSFTI